MSGPPRLRAFFITTDYPPDLGGLETYSHRIARDLPGGLLTHVAVGTRHPAGSLPKPAGALLSVHRGRGRLSALAWSSRRILALRLAGRIDATLHMQWSTALAPFLLRKAGLGKPYAVLIHGAELLDPDRPFLNRVKAAILADADAVIAGSRATADLFLRLGFESRRLEVIHYGNPLEQGNRNATPSATRSGPLRLLCMHRLVARKGTGLLLEALAGLRDLPWSLQVVGRGDEEEALRRKTVTLGLEGRVAFLPPVAEEAKAALLEGADLFILPSLAPTGNNHMEGLGLGLLEAQSRAVPVLAARTGGIPEAVREDGTGLLFEPGDAADLREKLRLLILDGRLRARLGAAGPAWVRERFDGSRNLGRLAEVLESLAGPGRGGKLQEGRRKAAGPG